MSTDSSNGWHEYKNLVMRELERLTQEIRHERHNFKQGFAGIYDRLIEVEKEVAQLKVKCGIWGLVGGLIPALTALILSKA